MHKSKPPNISGYTSQSRPVAKVQASGHAANAQPAQSEREKGLQELLHRLHTREFAPEHVKEAAMVVAQIQTKADSVRLAQRYIASPLVQVRNFARQLLQVVEAPEKTEANDAQAPAHMGYAAIAEVVKQWIHEEANRGTGGTVKSGPDRGSQRPKR